MKPKMFTDQMARESFVFSPSENRDARYNHNKVYSLIKPNVKLTTKKQSLGMR
jgi:hypothetical protein